MTYFYPHHLFGLKEGSTGMLSVSPVCHQVSVYESYELKTFLCTCHFSVDNYAPTRRNTGLLKRPSADVGVAPSPILKMLLLGKRPFVGINTDGGRAYL